MLGVVVDGGISSWRGGAVGRAVAVLEEEIEAQALRYVIEPPSEPDDVIKYSVMPLTAGS